MTAQEIREMQQEMAKLAANRHLQFAKQLLTLAQQHIECCINATPTSPRRNELTQENMALLNMARNLDCL